MCDPVYKTTTLAKDKGKGNKQYGSQAGLSSTLYFECLRKHSDERHSIGMKVLKENLHQTKTNQKCHHQFVHSSRRQYLA